VGQRKLRSAMDEGEKIIGREKKRTNLFSCDVIPRAAGP